MIRATGLSDRFSVQTERGNEWHTRSRLDTSVIGVGVVALLRLKYLMIEMRLAVGFVVATRSKKYGD